MKHAKLFLLLVLISFCASTQNRPGIDYYPHISFFDFPFNISTAKLVETELKSIHGGSLIIITATLKNSVSPIW